MWDDTDDGSAAGECGIGEGAHHADVRATVDELPATCGDGLAESGGGCEKDGIAAT
jgi:hypothetical protein